MALSPFVSLALISNPGPSRGINPAVARFGTNFSGILSTAAYNSLGHLSAGGLARLEKLERSITNCIKRDTGFKPGQAISTVDLNFGSKNKALRSIIDQARTLDRTKGVSLEPALMNGKFVLITAKESSADYPRHEQEGFLRIEETALGILSYTTIRTRGNDYRTTGCFIPPTIEREEAAADKALARIEEGQQPPVIPEIDPETVKGTIFSSARTIEDLYNIYNNRNNILGPKQNRAEKSFLRYMFGFFVNVLLFVILKAYLLSSFALIPMVVSGILLGISAMKLFSISYRSKRLRNLEVQFENIKKVNLGNKPLLGKRQPEAIYKAAEQQAIKKLTLGERQPEEVFEASAEELIARQQEADIEPGKKGKA